jgi:hypothetical protein
MSLAKIEEVFLYTCSEESPIETHELNAWLDHSGIQHIKLNYPTAQIQDVLSPLNTWWQEDENGVTQPPVAGFPLVVYTEVHSDKPVSYLPRKYIHGKEEIIAQLPALYQLGR